MAETVIRNTKQRVKPDAMSRAKSIARCLFVDIYGRRADEFDKASDAAERIYVEDRARRIIAADPATPLLSECEQLLSEAAGQFRFYEQQHLAKTPPDDAKAVTNREWAEKLEAALAKLRRLA